MPTAPRLRRLVLFLLTQIVLVVVLAEVGVRVLTRFNDDVRSLSYNPRLTGGFQRTQSLRALLARSNRGFKPFADVGGFRTNSMGLRTHEYSESKSSGGFRIVALGDSFTFAGQTEYQSHWPALLGSRLREELGVDTEVINLGYPAVGPRFELRMWQLEGSRLSADLVVQAFYTGNDFIDGLNFRVAPFTFAGAIADHSVLFRSLRNLRRYGSEAATIAAAGESEQRRPGEAAPTSGGYELDGYRDRSADRPTFRPRRFSAMVAQTMQVARISNRSRFEAAFERGAPILLDTRDAVESAGARYLLMIIPSEFQVDPEVALAGAASKGAELSDYETDWAQRRFEKFCESNEVACLDLLPAFRERGRAEKIYRLRNSDWNATGQAVAVEELVSWAASSLVP